MVSMVKHNRQTNATFTWCWGERERCRIVLERQESHLGVPAAFVEWPMSLRTVRDSRSGRYWTGVRPAGWVELSRLERVGV